MAGAKGSREKALGSAFAGAAGGSEVVVGEEVMPELSGPSHKPFVYRHGGQSTHVCSRWNFRETQPSDCLQAVMCRLETGCVWQD
jgi:hypothetical protein